jgi:hypothetical protein
VIDVRVCEQDCIDGGGRKWSLSPISVAQYAGTLEETAINQHASLIVVD